MKYKQHLRDNIAKEYGPTPYLDYGPLDDIIRDGTYLRSYALLYVYILYHSKYGLLLFQFIFFEYIFFLIYSYDAI